MRQLRAVDLFAGAGGFTTGLTLAGWRVLWAANHWRLAVDTHAANHPDTEHSCQDLHQVDPRTIPAHDLLAASPCCQGHSHARGKDRPEHDKSRSTAWAVVTVAEYHRPRFVLIENVPEFLDWILYPAWRAAMEALGYSLRPHVVDCADLGVPQNRVRLFLLCTLHGAAPVLELPQVEHVPASSFLRFDTGRWSPVLRPGRAVATIARWRAGRRDIGERFVMPYYGSGSGLTGRSIDRPIGAITTRDRWALVDGDRMRMATVDEYRAAMSFPDGYRIPSRPKKLGVHLLGNAVPSLAACEVGRAVARLAA